MNMGVRVYPEEFTAIERAFADFDAIVFAVFNAEGLERRIPMAEWGKIQAARQAFRLAVDKAKGNVKATT